jgi:hypothetical protein
MNVSEKREYVRGLVASIEATSIYPRVEGQRSLAEITLNKCIKDGLCKKCIAPYFQEALDNLRNERKAA